MKEYQSTRQRLPERPDQKALELLYRQEIDWYKAKLDSQDQAHAALRERAALLEAEARKVRDLHHAREAELLARAERAEDKLRRQAEDFQLEQARAETRNE
jgi:hypothetical protein